MKIRITLKKNNREFLQYTAVVGQPQKVMGRTLFCNFASSTNGQQGYGITEMHTGVLVSGLYETPGDAWRNARANFGKYGAKNVNKKVRDFMRTHSTADKLVRGKILGLW